MLASCLRARLESLEGCHDFKVKQSSNLSWAKIIPILISVCVQVAKQILKDSEDKSQVSLIYANQSPDDILLWEELEEMAAKHDNFKVHYVGRTTCPPW